MTESLKAFDKVLADVQEIKDKGNFLPDCSTKEGYAASKEFVLKTTTPARTALAKAHKEAKAFYLEGGRSVDAKKNELMSMLEEVQQPHQEAYKAVDEEKKRIKAEKEAAIQNGFDLLNGYAQQALNQGSEFINSLLDNCSDFDADPKVFGKEIQTIIELQQKVMGQLTSAMNQALQFEEMQRQQAELERKQAELDEAERKQTEAREAQERLEREAAQREQMRLDAKAEAAQETERLRVEAEQAEQRRIDQAKQARIDAENARIQAKENTRLAAEQAAADERQRQADEQSQADAEAARLEADKKHSRQIKTQACDCLVAGGLSEDQAKLAVKLIAARKIAHVKINY